MGEVRVMGACGSGCTVRGEHLAACLGVDEAGVRCGGCLPRRAEVGVLCSRCWSRLRGVVRTLPSLVEHLFEVAGQVGASSSSAGGVRRVAGPGGLYPAALGEADELHAMLAAWCAEVAEEHPGCSGGPPVVGSRWTASVVRHDPATGESWVSPSEVVGVRVPGATRALVGWLDPLLEWVAGRGWAPVMLEELGRASATASARWPVEEPDRRVVDVRCPSCGALSLVVCPPRVVGADVQVVCQVPACGRVLSEEDWGRARSWALAVARAAQDDDAAVGGGVGVAS